METAKRISTEFFLEDNLGNRVPGVSFVLTTRSGVTRKGKLNDKGEGRAKVIDGEGYALEYPDPEEVVTAAIAARLATALDAADHVSLVGLLLRPDFQYTPVEEVMNKYFARGGDLAEEIQTVCGGAESADAAGFALAGLGKTGNQTANEIVAIKEPKFDETEAVVA
jgi:hypothetical protein